MSIDADIAKVFRRIREEGIAQSRTCQWGDADGEECSHHDLSVALHMVVSVCTYGALYYAEKRGWIEPDTTKAMIKRLKEIAKNKFGSDLVTQVELDNHGWTFAMLEGLEGS